MLISRKNIVVLLLEWYDVGRSAKGADVSYPLMLLKCMLPQKCFDIPSNPELENQINARISFKKFLGIFSDKPSGDQSTFSRFRSRTSKEATTLTAASENDSKYLLRLTITGCHNTRAWVTTIFKNILNTMSRNMAFNISRSSKLLADV